MYTEGGANADTNFAGASSLYVNGSEAVSYTKGTKKGYFKIDLNGIPESERSTLSIHLEGGKQELFVYGLNDVSDVWSADTLTWHNAPANDKTGVFADPGGVYGGKELGKIAVNGSGVYTLDVTEFINYLKGRWKRFCNIYPMRRHTAGAAYSRVSIR